MLHLQKGSSNSVTIRLLGLLLVLLITLYIPSAISATNFEAGKYSFNESDGRIKLNIINDGGNDFALKMHFRISSSGANAATYKTDFNPIDNDDNISIGPGGTSASVSFDIIDDTIDEGEGEDFTVELWSGSVGESGVKKYDSTYVYIKDNDTAQLGYIRAIKEVVTVNEGQQASVGFERIQGSDGAIKAEYYVESGSANEGSDYTGTSGSLTWPDGDSSIQYVKVNTKEDQVDEPDEEFHVYLDNYEADIFAETKVVIKNVARKPGQINLEQYDYTVNENAGKITVKVRRQGGTDGKVSVDYRTSEMSDDKGSKATIGKDFSENKGTLTWNDGDSGDKSISIDILKDELNEGTERFALDFSNPGGGAKIDFSGRVSVSITDVPPEYGRIRIKTKAITVKENGGNASVTVERLDGSTGKVSVKYSTGASGDSAEKDKDYKNTSGALSWAAGDNSSKTIEIPLLTDLLKESNETFTLSLSGVSGGATLDSQKSASITIQDSTNFGSLQFKSASAKYSESAGTVNIEVERSGGSDGAVSVDYSIGSSTDTATNNADYKASNGTLSWANGDNKAKLITLDILRDELQENDESLLISLKNPKGNATLGDTSTSRITISDATSFGNISFSTANATTQEDAGSLVIKVQRTGGNDGAVSVRVRSGATNDTASAGSDYTALDEVIQWANGESGEKSVSLKVLEDDEIDATESLTLTLNEVGGGALVTSPTSMQVEIENTTLPKFGGIGFATANSNIIEGAGLTQFSVQREGGSDGVVTVQYTIGIAGDSAEEGTDYSTPKRSGELQWEDKSSIAQTIDVTILADAIAEDNETLTISLSGPTGGAALSTNSVHTITIQDTLPNDFNPVMNILSGDQQSGFPGTVLQPFVISVNDGDTPAPGVAVDWTIEPSDAGRLVDGDTTRANGDATASNTLEIIKGGVITVTATINTARSKNKQLLSRASASAATFTVNAGFEGAANLNPNQQRVGKALDNACPALEAANELTAQQQDLLDTCNALQSGGTANLPLNIARLTPEELFAVGTSLLDTSDIQVTNVQSRINAIRLGASGLDLASLQIDLYGQQIPGYVSNAIGKQLSGGGAGDGDDGRLGVFVNGSVAFGSLDETDTEMGLDFDTQGLTLGVDYRTDENWVFGGALGLTSHSGDYSSEGGKLALSGTSLSGFATWYDGEEAYFDAILSFGQNAFEVKRRINLEGQDDQFAISKPDASEFSLSIGAGLEYRSDAWQYGPYGRLGFTSAKVSSYKESASNPNGAGSGSVLAFEEQSLTSSLLVLGGQLSKTISTSSGVWIPQIRLELEHRLDDSNREIEATFIHDPTSTSFEISSENIDTDYLNFGTGVSAVFRNGKSGYLFYETRLGQDRLSQHWIKVGMRIEF